MTLELGGKSAAIFLEDGDIDTFLAGIGMASFMNNQQTIGNPLDPSVTMGPASADRSGAPTSSAAWTWPARSVPARSASTTTTSTWARPSAA
jgi:hypothetical protein